MERVKEERASERSRIEAAYAEEVERMRAEHAAAMGTAAQEGEERTQRLQDAFDKERAVNQEEMETERAKMVTAHEEEMKNAQQTAERMGAEVGRMA
eukprot:1207259-Rhodomonas_salina.1